MIKRWFRKKTKVANDISALPTGPAHKQRFFNGSAEQDFLTGVRVSRLPQLEDPQLKEIRSPRAAEGYPVVDVDHIIVSQKLLLSKIRQQGAFTEKEWESLVLPVVRNLAAYVHLLPASQEHHHDDTGGLFRHSLEVAYFSLRHQFDFHIQRTVNPQHQAKIEFRWKFCYFLASLLHDIGKPLTDFWVLYDPQRPEVNNWNPHVEPLASWAARHRVKKYFLNWSPARKNKHVRLSTLILSKIVPDDVLVWLNQYSSTPYLTMVDFLSMPSPDNQVGKVVYSADSESVSKNLKSKKSVAGRTPPGFQPLAVIFHCIRAMIARGDWAVNVPGARVWVVDEDYAFVVWRAAAKDIYLEARRYGNTIIPSDPDVLARLLIDHGYAFEWESKDGRHYYYHHIDIPMSSSALLRPKKAPPSAYALKVDIGALFDNMNVPKPVPVVVHDISETSIDGEPKKIATTGTKDANTEQPGPESAKHKVAGPQSEGGETASQNEVPAEPPGESTEPGTDSQSGADTAQKEAESSKAASTPNRDDYDCSSADKGGQDNGPVDTDDKPANSDQRDGLENAAESSSISTNDKATPDQESVIEHAGKYYIPVEVVEGWLSQKGMKLAAQLESVKVINPNPANGQSPIIKRNNTPCFELVVDGDNVGEVVAKILALRPNGEGAQAAEPTKKAQPKKSRNRNSQKTKPNDEKKSSGTGPTRDKNAKAKVDNEPSQKAESTNKDATAAKESEASPAPKTKKPRALGVQENPGAEVPNESAPVPQSEPPTKTASCKDKDFITAFIGYLESSIDSEEGIRQREDGAIVYKKKQYRVFAKAHPGLELPIFRMHVVMKDHPSVQVNGDEIVLLSTNREGEK